MQCIKNKEPLIVFLLISLAALIRLPFCVMGSHDLSFDNGMVGVMAREMFTHFYFTPFFYGYAYSSTIETFFTGIFLMILGYHKFAIYASVMCLHLATLYVSYLLAKECFGKKCGYILLTLLIIPSWPALFYGFYARVVYATTPLFSVLALYITLKIIKSPSLGSLRWLGFIYGLAWWNHSLIIYAAVTTFFMILIYKPRLLMSRDIWVLIPWFMFGSLPFWIFNLQTHFSSFGLLSAPKEISFLQGLQNVFLIQIPKLFLQTPFKDNAIIFHVLQNAYLLVFVCVLILFCVLALSRKDTRKGFLLVCLGCLSVWLIFANHNLSRFPLSRYILPSYYYMMIAISAGFGFISEKFKTLSFAGIGVILVLRIMTFIPESLAHKKHTEHKSTVFKEHILTPLKKHSLQSGTTNYWSVGPSLDFFSHGNIQLASNKHERDFKKFLNVGNTLESFFMYARHSHDYASYIKQYLPVQFAIPVQNKSITVLNQFDIHLDYWQSEELPHTFVKNAAPPQEKPFYVSDRNYQSIEASTLKEGAHHMEFYLDNATRINRMQLLPVQDTFFGHELNLNIWVLREHQKTWENHASIEKPLAVYTDHDTVIFNEEEPFFEIKMPSFPITAIKLTASKPFSFREVFLYTPKRDSFVSSKSDAALMLFLSEKKFSKLFTGRYLAMKLKKLPQFQKTAIVLPPNKSIWVNAQYDDTLTADSHAAIIMPLYQSSALKHFLTLYGISYQTSVQGQNEILFDFTFKIPLQLKWVQNTLCLDESIASHAVKLYHLKHIHVNPSLSDGTYEYLLSAIYPYTPAFQSSMHTQDGSSSLHPKNSPMFTPLLGCHVVFSENIELKGFLWEKNQNNPHSPLKAHFEFVTQKPIPDALAFFIHFKKNGQLIHQEDFFAGDDHHAFTTAQWITGLPIRITRSIQLPHSISMADMKIEMGIWKAHTDKKRLKIKSSTFDVTPDKTILLPSTAS